jgi:hypothetical protein
LVTCDHTSTGMWKPKDKSCCQKISLKNTIFFFVGRVVSPSPAREPSCKVRIRERMHTAHTFTCFEMVEENALTAA